MVDRSYLLDKPSPPSSLKVYAVQSALPALIDAAGFVEAQLERASVRARAAPLRSMATAFGIGWMVGFVRRVSRSREA